MSHTYVAGSRSATRLRWALALVMIYAAAEIVSGGESSE